MIFELLLLWRLLLGKLTHKILISFSGEVCVCSLYVREFVVMHHSFVFFFKAAIFGEAGCPSTGSHLDLPGS